MLHSFLSYRISDDLRCVHYDFSVRHGVAKGDSSVYNIMLIIIMKSRHKKIVTYILDISYNINRK